MKAHPYAELFPMMADDELRELAADIKANGQRDDIVTLDGEILDGRNRYRACEIAGVEPMTRGYLGNDPKAFVISANLHRRHLDASQRAMVAAKMADMERGGDRRKDHSANLPNGDTSQGKSADLLNVSTRTVTTASKVLADGTPDLVKAVEAGEVSVAAAAEVAKLPKAEQEKIVAKGPDAVKMAAKKAKTERQPKADKPKPEAKPDAEAEQAEDPADLVERLRKALKADAEIAEPLSKELRDLSEEVASVLPVPTIDDRIVALCRQLDSIAADMDSWKDDPLSYTISFITVQGGIKNVRTALWASRPCCECPYCKGTGKHPRHGEQCKGCKGNKLVTKTTEKSGKAAMGAA